MKNNKISGTEKTLINAYIKYWEKQNKYKFEKSDINGLENDIRKMIDNNYCEHREAVSTYLNTIIE